MARESKRHAWAISFLKDKIEELHSEAHQVAEKMSDVKCGDPEWLSHYNDFMGKCHLMSQLYDSLNTLEDDTNGWLRRIGYEAQT